MSAWSAAKRVKKSLMSENKEKPAPVEVDYEAACHCGAVQYTVKGPVIYNGLCHCLDCTKAMGGSARHVLIVPKDG